ncbi:hypothetical protein Skr01_29080 [Sphaerisporangium krabiense]|nr:hypothetical protein Skr01_29080 [Sphaerisporangium krabiense]
MPLDADVAVADGLACPLDGAARTSGRDRALSRRMCGDCGLDYNLIGGRPRREGVCDSCGGRLEAREVDTPEALTARIDDHRESIAALLDRLRRKAPVFVVDASRDPDTVQEEIRTLLGLPS